MNGDDKEEAHRPRPLSGGIWTLFSWLRRSEKSSSSESLSSVGSARTAVSFDFLSPGNCNYANTPVVLTTQLGPPTETYKKRLQERNLRLQRDRDITLHRKYGLFKEYGNGYDGFSLPPNRRVLANSVDRHNRERRATSECLQRRSAYVPGKRRAPLPPAFNTSASLPRSYKRKRPAPKPPIIKQTVEELQENHSTRMSSNLGSDGILTLDLEVSMHSKSEKHDKKITGSQDVKPKADKSFLKHIFENRKRNSAVETSGIRLLPSISELDKQAAEIVENNKLRQSKNCENFENDQSSKTCYEGNSWFCTSCLRKYNSSVNSCNNCYRDKNSPNTSSEKRIAESSLKSSIYTQTQNVESPDLNQNNADERKILKEILKEMKDSLPKKSRDRNNKINNFETETPTLQIGSTVPEKYKDPIPQPLSSDAVRCYNISRINAEIPSSSRILPISSLLSVGQNNLKESNNRSNDHNIPNIVQHKITVEFDNHANKSNIKNLSPKSSDKKVNALLTRKDQTKVTDKNSACSKESVESISIKTDNVKLEDISTETSVIQSKNFFTKEIENKKSPSSQIKSQQNSNSQSIGELPLSSPDINQRKNTNKSSSENQIRQADTSNNCKKVLNTAVSTEPIIVKPLISETNSSKCNIVLSNITVITSNSNTSNSNILSASKLSTVNEAENKSTTPSTSNISKDSEITNVQFKDSQNCKSTDKSLNFHNKKSLQNSGDKIKSVDDSVSENKPVSNLHTPLKISMLLNPLYNSRLPTIKENDCTKIDLQLKNEKQTSFFGNKNNDVQKSDNQKFPCQSTTSPAPALTKLRNDFITKSQKRATHKTEQISKNEMPKSTVDHLVNDLPSTSASSISKDTSNPHKLEQYDRRRHLIHQLEQSIAKGDEVAAAEAAVQLAKLKLSCSVLTFSSQIIGESSKQKAKESEQNMQKLVSKVPLTEKRSDQNLTNTEIAPSANNNSSNIHPDTTTHQLETDTKLEDTKIANANRNNNKDDELQSKPSSSNQAAMGDIVPIDVWVEDKQAVRGPIRLRISRRACITDLRRQAEHSLGLAAHLQRWIVGKTLCSDDSTMVVSLAGPDFRAPFYLCVVQSEKSDKVEILNTVPNEESVVQQSDSNEFYTELVRLEQQSLVKNLEPFECSVCMEECGAGAGVVLRECIHTFCRECLSDVVQHSQEPTVSCPATGCSGLLQEREIRSIVSPEEYERWLARSLATAECGTRNTFHCRTPDCTGWAFCDPGVRRFPCPVCKHTNCVQCQAIHEGETCEQHQVKLREAVTAAETYKDDEGTQALLNSLISRGEALECPECKAIITKKWGCDWVKCSACKTEICWVTKGRRWGPGGRGDTSGGCRCGVDGQRCHPSCGYCH